MEDTTFILKLYTQVQDPNTRNSFNKEEECFGGQKDWAEEKKTGITATAFGPNLRQAPAPGIWRTPGNGLQEAFCDHAGVLQDNKAQLQGAGVVQQVVK